MRSFLLLSGLFCSLLSFAQTDTLPVFPETPPLLEDVLQDAEEEVDFDFDTYYEPLEALREHPLDLNRADREQLQEIRLLNDLQIEAFLEYRATAGPLLALYELQVIPGFDLPTIRRLLPYVSLRSSLDDFHVPLPRMLSAGKNELYLRWSRTLESSRGFSWPAIPAYPGASSAIRTNGTRASNIPMKTALATALRPKRMQGRNSSAAATRKASTFTPPTCSPAT